MLKKTFLRALVVLGALAPLRGQCLDFSNDFAAAGAGVNNLVRALATFDDGSGTALYAAGDFTLAGGLPVGHIAKWNGSSWSALGSGTSGSVFSLQVFDDGSGPRLYVGGVFAFAGGLATGSIACWDGNSWSPVGAGIPNGSVRALHVHDDGSGPALYAGGTFIQAGFAPAANVARFQGGVWSALGLGTGSDVKCFASFDSGSGPALYVGGYFTTAGGVATNRIARWQNDNWAALQGGVNGSGNVGVFSLKPYFDGVSTKLFVGGRFDYVNGSQCSNLARWTGSGWQACSPALTCDGPVDSLEAHDDGSGLALYAGGTFSIGGIPAPEGNVARWNGTNWTTLSTGLRQIANDHAGLALVSSSFLGASRLFVGGSFSHAGGKNSPYVAVWGEACSAPLVLTHPQPVTAVFNQTIVFNTTAVGTAPVSYQWRRNGVPLVDDAHMLGATTPSLSLWYYTYADHGDYDCVISNGMGSVTCDLARLTIPLSGSSGSPLHLRKVVYPPEPVSTLPPGNTFELVGPPRQSSTGEIGSSTTISGQRALVLFDQTIPKVLIKGLDPAPVLGPGVTFPGSGSGLNALDSFIPAANGQVAVRGDVEGWAVTLETRKVIWRFHPAGVEVVVREGDAAVGFAPGLVHRLPYIPVISDSGRVVFRSHVFQNGLAVSIGIWAWDQGVGRQLLAKLGDTAPGSTAHYRGLNDEPHVGPTGTVLFAAQLDSVTGIHTFTTWDSALFAGDPGGLQRIAASGDPAPGMPAGSNIETFTAAEVDATGGILFTAFVAFPTGGGSFATYRWSSGSLTLLTAQGDVLPGVIPGSVVAGAQPWDANALGSVALNISLQPACNPPCSSRGLWLRSAAGYETIAMNGDFPYPGMPAGFTFASFDSLAMNNQDQVVFGMRAYAGTSVNAVYGWSRETGLFPIAVPGGQFDLGLQDYRTIQSALLSDVDGPSHGTQGTQLDDSGLVSLRVEFTDATNGIFTADFNSIASVFGNTGVKFCFGDGTGSPCPCGNSGLPGQGCANTTGSGADLTGLGSVSVSEDDLRFLAVNLPANKACVLLQSASVAAGGLGVPFHDGLLCLSPPIKRLRSGVSTSGGQFLFGPGLATSGLWAGGQTRYFQTWFRNNGGPCGNGSNLSNAFSVNLVP